MNWLAVAMPWAASTSIYQPGKSAQELRRESGISESLAVVKLASNENPRGPGPKVMAVIGAEAAACNRYPDANGFALKVRLAKILGVNAEGIVLGNGSNELCDLLARLFLGPGRNAVVSEHCFISYPLAVRMTGAQLRVAPARSSYRCDLDAMVKLVDADTRLIFVTSPNNPTGDWQTIEALESMLELVPGHVPVILDEAYFEYARGSGCADGMILLRRHENLIVTRTFSKAYGLAGLRIGYSVSNDQIAALLHRVREPFNVNSVAQAAALAALDDEEHIARSVALNAAGMAQLEEGLDLLGLDHLPSAGNFITFATGYEDAQPVYAALLHQGVIVRPLHSYNLPGHLRVSIGLPEENDRFLVVLREVLRR